MDLPLKDYGYYVGIDPGFKGAVAVMNAAGTTARVWPMPITQKDGRDRSREIDLEELDLIFKAIGYLPENQIIGIEWPTTRPDEGAERSERFGRQKGYLEAFCFCKGLPYHKIAPNLWKGRLGLDGKTIAGANERAAKYFETFYPERSNLIRGPRGGVLDGPLDALLIAHFLRTRGGNGLKSVAAKFGKDSNEMFVAVMGGGRRKKKFGKRLDQP